MTILRVYDKLPQTSAQHCEALIGKGLNIPDQATAIKIIDQIGYYRLKSYMLPFRDISSADKPFKDGTEFGHVSELYRFDEELRNLVFSYIQRIEVGVRSSFSDFMCHLEGNAFWHIDSGIFGHGNVEYAVTISKIRNMYLSSHEEFVSYYKKNYYNVFCKFYTDVPPSWVFIELMSFGNLSSTLRHVHDDYVEDKKLNKMASKKLGINKFKKLCNWLSVIHEVRNHTAHHARLFNRNMKAPDAIKQVLSNEVDLVKIGDTGQDQLNRIYSAFAVMQVILRKLGYPPIGPDIDRIFARYPIHADFKDSMGFPEDWVNEPLFR